MRKSTMISVGVITAAIVIAPGIASAANGAAALIARNNYGSAPTGFVNTSGTPLGLAAKAGFAPMTVNSAVKVTNLNADRLDGLDSTTFAVRAGRTGSVAHDGTLDGMGAACPTGTVFVSGGGFMPSPADYIYYSGPDWNVSDGSLIPNSWIVVGDNGVGYSNVTCYSPSGAPVVGAVTNISQLTGPPATLAPLTATGRGPALSDTAIAKIAQVKQDRATR